MQPLLVVLTTPPPPAPQTVVKYWGFNDITLEGSVMSEQQRPLVDRVWEFTKDISVKVSRKAEKHWKINTLRVEIASIKHRINVKYRELGRYVYESLKLDALEETSYKASIGEFYDELSRLEGEIVDRENRIEILEQEMREQGIDPDAPYEGQDQAPPPPPPASDLDETPPPPPPAQDAADTADETKAEASTDASNDATANEKAQDGETKGTT